MSYALQKKKSPGTSQTEPSVLEEASSKFSKIGFILTIMLLVIQGIETGFYFLVEKAAPELWDRPWMSWVMVAVGFYLTAFPLYCILMKKIPDAPKGGSKPLGILNLAGFYFIGMAALYLFNLLSMILNSMVGTIKGGVLDNPLNTVVDSSNLYYTILFVGIVAPIIEEVIFRGILLNKLRCYGDKIAMWITALTYGFFHLNIIQIIYATVLGILFAYVVVRTGRIRYSIFLHICINMTGMVVAPALSGAGHLTLVGSMIYCFVFVGIVVFIIMRRKFYLEKGAVPIENKAINRTVFLNKGMLAYFGACILIMAVTIILKNR